MFFDRRRDLWLYFQRHWRAILLLLLGILLPLLLVMDLTEDVFRDGGFKWDQQILQWYRLHRTPGLTKLAEGVSNAGSLAVLPFVTLGAALALAKYKDRLYGWFLIFAVFGATALNILVKLIFRRPRPDQLLAVLTEQGYSFPSGHTMSNAALSMALIFIFWRTKYFWPVALLSTLWAVAVGASRNYLGVHYPTDVLVGFLSSVIWVTGLRLLTRSQWPERPHWLRSRDSVTAR